MADSSFIGLFHENLAILRTRKPEKACATEPDHRRRYVCFVDFKGTQSQILYVRLVPLQVTRQ